MSCVLNVTAREPFSVIRRHSVRCHIANLSYVFTVDPKALCTLQISWAHHDIAGPKITSCNRL